MQIMIISINRHLRLNLRQTDKDDPEIQICGLFTCQNIYNTGWLVAHHPPLLQSITRSGTFITPAAAL